MTPGLRDEWLQHGGSHREHYDVTDTVRERALALGAEPLSYPRGTGEYISQKRLPQDHPQAGGGTPDAAGGSEPEQDVPPSGGGAKEPGGPHRPAPEAPAPPPLEDAVLYAAGRLQDLADHAVEAAVQHAYAKAAGMVRDLVEANDVNRVLSWVLGIRTDWDHDDEALFWRAGESAGRLAERAHKRLSAGLTGDQVRAAWPRVEAGPWLDVTQPKVEDVDTGDLT